MRTRRGQAGADGVGYRWELDRLIEVQGAATPANWLARARRAHLHAREGRREQAEKEYQRIEAVAREPLLVWYQQRAAEATYAGDSIAGPVVSGPLGQGPAKKLGERQIQWAAGRGTPHAATNPLGKEGTVA